MSGVTKILFLVIPLVLLIIVGVIFFGETGIFEDTKDAANDAINNPIVNWIVPRVSVGEGELNAELQLPTDLSGELATLIPLINQSLRWGENCFAHFGGFSDLDQSGASFQLTDRGDYTLFTVYGGGSGRQEIVELRTEFPNMKPCVIAGSERVPQNFYDAFIEENPLCEGPCLPYYQEVPSITIAWDDGGFFGLAENRISYGGDFQDSEALGWLFTPDGEHICFFPTRDGGNDCAPGENGLDDDCFTDADEEDSLLYLLNQGRLNLCLE